jgi:hypothetical protein
MGRSTCDLAQVDQYFNHAPIGLNYLQNGERKIRRSDCLLLNCDQSFKLGYVIDIVACHVTGKFADGYRSTLDMVVFPLLRIEKWGTPSFKELALRDLEFRAPVRTQAALFISAGLFAGIAHAPNGSGPIVGNEEGTIFRFRHSYGPSPH